MTSCASGEIRARFHPESKFGGFTDIDGAMTFYARVQELLTHNDTALDVGCGHGSQGQDPVTVRRELRILRGKCARVIGIDVDPGAASNEHIDEFRAITPDGSWPLPDVSVDLAIADLVLEHVKSPEAFFTQAARVIRPGGYLCIRTTNAHSYLGIASRITPNSRHVEVLARSQPDRRREDVFPTYYRCNTVRRLRAALAGHGFEAVVYGFEPEPDYLTFSVPLYALGLIHRRFVPAALRVGILAWARRLG